MHGDLSFTSPERTHAADRHLPVVWSLLSVIVPWVRPSLLLLICILLQLSGEERAGPRIGSRCSLDGTTEKMLRILRRQVFLFVFLRFADGDGCIKNKCH